MIKDLIIGGIYFCQKFVVSAMAEKPADEPRDETATTEDNTDQDDGEGTPLNS